ncbi:MAG TPA: ABC transporter ATP-binding protein [Acidimicrobiales bacterium]|nr:ABC transporter ATP-binding protein [Acidimicrobiales bacterium]
MADAPRPRGRLRPAELAEAAVLGDVALILSLAGWWLPFGYVLFVAATVPFAALVVRRRLRAAVVAAVAVGQVAFLMGGIGLEGYFFLIALCGITIGVAYRRGWGRGGTAVLAVGLAWVPTAVVTLVALTILSESRRLTLKQIDIGSRWARRFARRMGYAEVARQGDRLVHWVITHWWSVFPAAELVGLVGIVLVARRVALPALRRLDASFARPSPEVSPAEDGPPRPLPVVLEEVRVRYQGAEDDALSGVGLRIEPATLVAVVGENGSGKSTLARVLAGRAVASGRVLRPGAAALGQAGGTAMVFQRPESQVLGVRVRDDVVWGMTNGADVDVAALLELVGLSGFADRETATLSGGELQRLAIAAALARRPALLISDEATSMLDRPGRHDLTEVLRRLPGLGTAVVHVTHHLGEAAIADVVVGLAHGRVVAVGAPPTVLGREAGATP